MAGLPIRRIIQRQLIEPHRHDPYRTDSKPEGNPQCPICLGICVRGRWYALEDARKRLPRNFRAPAKQECPACRKFKDHYAMGVVEIHGEAWKDKAPLVAETILNTEKILRSRNDQERILWSRTYRNVTKYYVTLPELARQIGRTLGRSFKGKVEYRHSTEEPYLRVIWHSDSGKTLRPSSRKRK